MTPLGIGRLIPVSLLVTGFVGFLVFVLLEMAFLGMVPAMRFVIFALAHTLLIGLIFRIILVVILEQRSRGAAYGEACRQRQYSGEVSKVDFHSSYPFLFGDMNFDLSTAAA
jgi:hypothetical protein